MGALTEAVIQSAKARDMFVQKTFSRVKNVPSPGLGMFDAEYSPAQGSLNITVKCRLQLTTATNQKLIDFQQAFQKFVPQYWNGKIALQCVREGLFRFSVKWRDERSPLVSIPPLWGGDFQGMRVYRSDVVWVERET